MGAAPRLSFLDLAELELDGRGTSEDGHRYTELALVVVDFLDAAVEVGERPFMSNLFYFKALMAAPRGAQPFELDEIGVKR